MQELGNAINDSLSDSDRIAEAIGEIKQAGYDVFLVLEATIGFNKRDEDDECDKNCGSDNRTAMHRRVVEFLPTIGAEEKEKREDGKEVEHALREHRAECVGFARATRYRLRAPTG